MTCGAIPTLLRTIENPEGRPLVPNRESLVFHHIPKTAGSTFRRILEILFEPEKVCPAEYDPELVDRAPGQRLFAGHFSLDAVWGQLGDAIGLVFLRDPIQRIVSEFDNIADWSRFPPLWRRRIEARPRLRAFLDRIAGLSLEQYIMLDDPLVRDRIVNRQTRSLLTRHDLRTLECGFDEEVVLDLWNHPDELIDADPALPTDEESLLVCAKRNLQQRFAFVGVQEHFELALQLFAMTFGLRPFGDLSAFTININPRETRIGAEALPDELLHRLRELNRMDLALWDHARQLMLSRIEAFQAPLLRADAFVRERGGDLTPLFPRTLAISHVSRTVDEMAVRRGFHRIEHDGLGRPFCWSGYEDPAILETDFDVPDAADLEVAVHVVNAIDEAARAQSFLTFDDRPLESTHEETGDGEYIVRGRVRRGRPHWPRRHHAIKIHGPRSLEPNTVEHRRLLGLAVHEVTIRILDDPN